jgi:hypothetical protein
MLYTNRMFPLFRETHVVDDPRLDRLVLLHRAAAPSRAPYPTPSHLKKCRNDWCCAAVRAGAMFNLGFRNSGVSPSHPGHECHWQTNRPSIARAFAEKSKTQL